MVCNMHLINEDSDVDLAMNSIIWLTITVTFASL